MRNYIANRKHLAVCIIVPEGELPEWDREPALRAAALGRAWILLACTCGAVQVGAV